MPDSIVMVQAFAELRYGAVVHTRENSMKYGHNLGQTLYHYAIYAATCGHWDASRPRNAVSWILGDVIPF